MAANCNLKLKRHAVTVFTSSVSYVSYTNRTDSCYCASKHVYQNQDVALRLYTQLQHPMHGCAWQGAATTNGAIQM